MITVFALVLAAVFALFNADTISGVLVTPQPPLEQTSQPSTRVLEAERVTNGTETETLLLELRKQYLDDRAETINWWLIAVTIALAIVTLMFVAAGFVGYQVFRIILEDARRARDDARTIATEIQAFRQQAHDDSREIQKRFESMPRYESPVTNPMQLDDNVASTLEVHEHSPASRDTSQTREEEADPVRAANALFAEGYQYGQMGDYASAVSSYDQAIELQPQFAAAYNNRGHAQWMLGDYDQAIADCGIAIKLSPHYVEAYNNRGNAKFSSGLRNEAIQDYDTAVQLNAAYAPSYNNRGSANYQMGNYVRALDDFDQAIQADPQYADAFYNRGNTQFRLAKHDMALVDYNEAVRINPEYTNAHYNLGWTWTVLGNRVQALMSFATALELASRQGNSTLVMQIRQAIESAISNS